MEVHVCLPLTAWAKAACNGLEFGTLSYLDVPFTAPGENSAEYWVERWGRSSEPTLRIMYFDQGHVIDLNYISYSQNGDENA